MTIMIAPKLAPSPMPSLILVARPLCTLLLAVSEFVAVGRSVVLGLGAVVIVPFAVVEVLAVVDVVWGLVVAVGRNPPFQSILSPVAVGKLALLANVAASMKATVRLVLGHQQGCLVVTVLTPRFASQPVHWLEVPLQYTRPSHASSGHHQC
jgi:hypothetical protein